MRVHSTNKVNGGFRASGDTSSSALMPDLRQLLRYEWPGRFPVQVDLSGQILANDRANGVIYCP
jgi:hypothetical protein